MTNNSKNAAEKLIAFSIAKDKPGIIKILQRNGVSISDSDSPKRVSAAVLAGLRSQSFRKDLTNLLGKNALDNKALFAQNQKVGVTGALEELSSGSSTSTGSDGDKLGTPGGTGTKAPSNFGNFLNQTILKPDTVNQFISTGLNALNTSLATKREAAAQKTLQLQNDAAVYQNYNPTQGGAGGAAPLAPKTNKGLIIGLSILGVAIIGTGLYFALRKKK